MKGQVLAGSPWGSSPRAWAWPDGTLVNTTETTNMAHFIDTATNTIVDNVLVDSRPRVAEFNPDGSQVWVSAEIGGTVTVIDPNTRKILGKVAFQIPGVNQDAPIICCTAEILANTALREDAAAELGAVIMDEFHFYSDPQRAGAGGPRWNSRRFLLMSRHSATAPRGRHHRLTGR
jgi:hypothetical protein